MELAFKDRCEGPIKGYRISIKDNTLITTRLQYGEALARAILLLMRFAHNAQFGLFIYLLGFFMGWVIRGDGANTLHLVEIYLGYGNFVRVAYFGLPRKGVKECPHCVPARVVSGD